MGEEVAADVGCDLLALGLEHVGDPHVGAGARALPGLGLSLTPGPAGDEDHLAVELSHVASLVAVGSVSRVRDRSPKAMGAAAHGAYGSSGVRPSWSQASKRASRSVPETSSATATKSAVVTLPFAKRAA